MHVERIELNGHDVAKEPRLPRSGDTWGLNPALSLLAVCTWSGPFHLVVSVLSTVKTWVDLSKFLDLLGNLKKCMTSVFRITHTLILCITLEFICPLMAAQG